MSIKLYRVCKCLCGQISFFPKTSFQNCFQLDCLIGGGLIPAQTKSNLFSNKSHKTSWRCVNLWQGFLPRDTQWQQDLLGIPQHNRERTKILIKPGIYIALFTSQAEIAEN